VLHHDGRDLAAALQTISEIGNEQALQQTIADAFPGSSLAVAAEAGRFRVQFSAHGLLRPLDAAELSDGTLRYLLLVAALLSPRPPRLMVLNEPETSLHPELLPPLARLVGQASATTQIVVVSHSAALLTALQHEPQTRTVELVKDFGETRVAGAGPFDGPVWNWGTR
jgi:predicted ATPase